MKMEIDGGGGGGGGECSQQVPAVYKTMAMAYLEEVERVFKEQDKNIKTFNNFRRLLKDFRTRRIDPPTVVHRVKQLFQGHPNLILGFNAFLPKLFQITLDDDDDDGSDDDDDQAINRNALSPKSNQITLAPQPDAPVEYDANEYQQAINFANKIKMRFQDEHHVYESFVKILMTIIHRRIRSSSSPSSKEKQNPNSNWTSSSTSSHDDEDDDDEETEAIFHKVAALFKDHPDLISDFTHFLPTHHQHNYHSYPAVTPTATVKDKGLSLNRDQIHEHQQKQHDCTPSYTLLPKDFPNPCASKRRVLDFQVLNDRCVQCATTSTGGNRDRSSSSSMHKTLYEQRLFRCEDERFELDMLLESMNSTADRVEQLLDKIENEKLHDKKIRLENHFTAMNLRCIERLYGEFGLEVVDALRENTAVALPVILNRLKQKQQEWETCRSDLNLVWAQVICRQPLH